MPLTPADVRKTVRHDRAQAWLRPGRSGCLLDEVEAELDRSRERGAAGPSSPRLCGAARWRANDSPHMPRPTDARAAPAGAERPEPMPMMKSSAEDNMDTAARVLALAQQTADQAIADARREADGTQPGPP